MQIEIKSATTEPKEISPRNGGDTFVLYEQIAKMALNDEIRNLRITSTSDTPYPVGKYKVSDQSYYLDQFGALKMGRLVLEPIS